MKFIRGSFPIQNIEEAPERVEVVFGWLEESRHYGFYKRRDYWVATDLLSGTKICDGVTRKECVRWLEENSKKIAETRLTKTYYEKVMSFQELLKIELNKED